MAVMRGVGVAACVFSAAAAAQETYPAKPVSVIVPFAPGGGADVMARLIFSKVSKSLGQSFVIENKPGAGGLLGADIVAKSKPDGYTLLLGQTGPNAINPALFKDLPYDPIKDFAPVIQLTSYPYVIIAHPSIPAKTFQELIEQSKAQPGRYTFGTAGLGSSAQLAGEMLMRETGIKMVHVPFKGAGPALLNTISHVVDVTFGDMASATPQVNAGKVRALAVTGPKRVPLLPDVPTVAELGYAGFDAQAWHGVYAPADTPDAIIDKLNGAIAVVLKEPEIIKRLQGDGIEPIGESPRAFGEYTAKEVKKWGDIVRDANITLSK